MIRVERSWDPVKAPVYGHLVPGGEDTARERLDAFLTPAITGPTVAHTVAHYPHNDEPPTTRGF